MILHLGIVKYRYRHLNVGKMEREEIDRIWVELNRNRGHDFRLTYIELKNLIERFEKLNPDIDPMAIDWATEIDPTISYDDNLKNLAAKYPMYQWHEVDPESYEDQVDDEYQNYIYNEAEKLGIIDKIKRELQYEISDQLKDEIIRSINLDELRNGLEDQVKAMAKELSDKAMASINWDKIVDDIVKDQVAQIKADIKAMAGELVQAKLSQYIEDQGKDKVEDQKEDKGEDKAPSRKTDKAMSRTHKIAGYVSVAVVAFINMWAALMIAHRVIAINGLNPHSLLAAIGIPFMAWLSDVALAFMVKRTFSRRGSPNPIGFMYGRPR